MKEERIILAHGGGGRLARELVESVFVSRFDNPLLNRLNDGAVLDIFGQRLAMSTDSYVVSPLFFPGGNIGDLAVNGTVNDLAMCGARPLYLSAGFIIEEGFGLAELERIADSMRAAAARAEVEIVTGDTKVVNRGACDGLYINTAGVGLVPAGVDLGGEKARPGDAVIISGHLGDHGAAILCQREGLNLSAPIRSDSAPLGHMVHGLLQKAPQTRALRDPTRGGLAAILNEIADQSRVGMVIEEKALPILPEVRAVCELLGLDPLYLANEGKMTAIVPPEQAGAALSAIRESPHGAHAAIIGQVTARRPGRVVMRTGLGTERVVDMPAGELLPRIC